MMKTIVPLKDLTFFAVLFAVVTVFSNTAYAQSSLLTNGLSFNNPSLTSGTGLQVGAVYRFQDVFTDVDATVTIDSLVNGAKVKNIDDNNNGVGYKDAFQPAIQSGNVVGRSYAVFTFRFYEKGTSTPISLESVNATALDLDGNVMLKEFAEIRMGAGGSATYMSTTSDLSILQMLTGDFMGENILGIERSGIDTASYANMFTASNSGIYSFSLRYGTNTTLASQSTRQFSLYMKGFAYPDQATLPLELLSFSAVLNKTKVDLNWTTLWERNLSHFELERSFDGKDFKQTGIIFGIGNSDFKTNYSFSDNINSSKIGLIYYRLKLMDADGKYGYSEIRVIRIGEQTETARVMAYPNPVVSDLRITIPANWQGRKAKYEIFNIGGKLVKTVMTGSASQTEVIKMDGFGAGLYIVRASNDKEVAQQKIIKR